MKSRLILILTILYLFCNSISGQEKRNINPIAILGAFNMEIEMLKDSIQNKRETNVCGLSVTTGTLYGQEVVIAYTGMGKVNAAMTTTLIVNRFRPAKVIFTGIAGRLNPELHPGDIVIGKMTVQHDLNVVYRDSTTNFTVYSPITDEKVPVYFPADNELLLLTQVITKKVSLLAYPVNKSEYQPRITTGIIATGDAFVASSIKNEEIHARFNADAVEMEGAAIAQICYYMNTPCIIIRSISDSADEQAETDIMKYLEIAARNSNLLIIGMLQEMEKEFNP